MPAASKNQYYNILKQNQSEAQKSGQRFSAEIGHRKMKRHRSLVTAFLLGLSVLPAHSDDLVPHTLFGHSIVASWTELRAFQPTDLRGTSHGDILNGTADVYVSVHGNIFGRSRRHVSIVGSGATRSFSWEDVKDGAANYVHWRFDGGTLAGDVINTQGVRRLSISFGSDFKSCSVNVIYGKPAGKPAFIIEGWHHDTYYLQSVEISARHCEIKDGNVLAGSY